ncbi:MAG: alpha-ketoglutarate-dependent dioxygenase AlkB [Bacteroidia bacterium]
MDLFTPATDPRVNLLPLDGEAYYHGPIFTLSEANALMNDLLHTTHWQHDELTIMGRRIVTQRETAWYGDVPFSYTYSHATKVALPWTESLRRIRDRVQDVSGHPYNACLLNLYHDGSEGMGWHSDDEPEIVRDSAIASVSLGAERAFDLKHKQSGEKVRVMLAHGSLLVMAGVCQQYWVHALPKALRVKGARVNLTFRQMKTE